MLLPVLLLLLWLLRGRLQQLFPGFVTKGKLIGYGTRSQGHAVFLFTKAKKSPCCLSYLHAAHPHAAPRVENAAGMHGNEA